MTLQPSRMNLLALLLALALTACGGGGDSPDSTPATRSTIATGVRG